MTSTHQGRSPLEEEAVLTLNFQRCLCFRVGTERAWIEILVRLVHHLVRLCNDVLFWVPLGMSHRQTVPVKGLMWIVEHGWASVLWSVNQICGPSLLCLLD